MMGFTLPLFVLGGMQGCMSVFLLLPSPLNKPAIKLAQASNTDIGRTVVYTISAFLGFLLIAPLFDLFQLIQSQKATVAGVASPDTLTSPEHRSATLTNPEHRAVEATSTLSAVMTGSLLLNMFVLQRFGLVLGYNEKLAAGKYNEPSEAEYARKKLGLKQPKGQQVTGGAANLSSTPQQADVQTVPTTVPTPADPLMEPAGTAPGAGFKKEL
jgi:hypothetical protein